MLSLGPLEIMLILALALVFLGPEKLPDVARQVGKFVGQIRRTTDELKRTLDAEIRDEERERRLAEYRERQAKAVAEREKRLQGTGEGEGEATQIGPDRDASPSETDTIKSVAGADTVQAVAGADTVQAVAGADTIQAVSEPAANEPAEPTDPDGRPAEGTT